MVKVIINGTEIIETPDGWLNFTTTLRYDKELKALFEIVEAPLTFYHDGYRMIKAAYDANGYCFQYPVTILREDELNQYIPIFEGVLFFKDIEFTEGIEGYSAKCQFTDNSFFAKIYNNRNLKAKIYVPRSKSDLTITAATYSRVKFFNPTTGTYYVHLGGPSDVRNDTAFRVYDVFRFLVDFMSDGEVDFISDYFAPGGLGEGAMITCGKIPRFTQSGGMTQELFEEIWPDLSFADVFKELDKVYNLGIRAGFDGARPYIRIENNSYLFPNTALQNLAYVTIVKRKTALEYLYAKVVIGSTIVTDEVFLSFPADIRFVGTKEEEYVIVQDCNTDRELNLVNDWIIDTNTIEDLVVNYATVPITNDAQIILIDCEYLAGTSQEAKQSNWLAIAPPYYYNEQYINSNKAQRYLGGIPASIAAYLNTDANRFRVTNTNAYPPTLLVGYNPIPFNDDSTAPNFDNGGNFNVTLGQHNYTFPETSVYTYLIEFTINVAAQDVLTVYAVSYDPTLTTTQNATIIYQGTPPLGVSTIRAFATGYGVAGDKVDLEANIAGGSGIISPGMVWELTSIGANGGIFGDFDPRDYPIIRNQFDYPMSFKEYRTLKAQPLGLLSFGVHDAKTYFAWIEEIKYKHFQDTSNFMLISNETTN